MIAANLRKNYTILIKVKGIIIFKNIYIALMVISALAAAQIVSAEDKQKLPIQLGIYVPEGVDCPKPRIVKSEVREYPKDTITFHGTGFGFEDSNMFWYYITSVKNKGIIYYIKGETSTGAGGGYIGKYSMMLSIDSKTSFSIIRAKGPSPTPEMNKKKVYRYRYCGKD